MTLIVGNFLLSGAEFLPGSEPAALPSHSYLKNEIICQQKLDQIHQIPLCAKSFVKLPESMFVGRGLFKYSDIGTFHVIPVLPISSTIRYGVITHVLVLLLI